MVDADPVNYLLKTPIGHLKIASSVVGFFGMAFIAGGLAHHTRGWTAILIHSHNHRHTLYPDDFPKLPFFSEYQVWMADLSAFLIILSWLFSLFILVAAFIRPLDQRPISTQIDAWGHLAAAVTLALGAILTAVYVANVCNATCGAHGVVTGFNEEVKRDNRRAEKLGLSKRVSLMNCPKAVFLDEDMPYAEKGRATGRDAAYGGAVVGFRAILFILAALLALGQAVLCVIIFVQGIRKQRKRPPNFAMMTVNDGEGISMAPTALSVRASNAPSRAGSRADIKIREQLPSAKPSKVTVTMTETKE